MIHHPFVPFSILFSHAVQVLDVDDLSRLEHFAASLELEHNSARPTTDFQQLYKLLCQAARLYIQANTPPQTVNQALPYDDLDPANSINIPSFDIEEGTTVNETIEHSVFEPYDLNDWNFQNQQFAALLDEDITL